MGTKKSKREKDIPNAEKPEQPKPVQEYGHFSKPLWDPENIKEWESLVALPTIEDEWKLHPDIIAMNPVIFGPPPSRSESWHEQFENDAM